MSEAVTTTQHADIQEWVETRGGRPCKAAGGVLRIDFGEPDEGLEPIGWDEFFEIFEERQLAFLHQDRTDDDKVSRFNKFIDR
jgi:hypothetical protein